MEQTLKIKDMYETLSYEKRLELIMELLGQEKSILRWSLYDESDVVRDIISILENEIIEKSNEIMEFFSLDDESFNLVMYKIEKYITYDLIKKYTTHHHKLLDFLNSSDLTYGDIRDYIDYESLLNEAVIVIQSEIKFGGLEINS
jgi:hypothetical protein